MITVELKTRDGRAVHTATIPPFTLFPEALLWGDRFFVRRDHQPIYYEGLLYSLDLHWPVGPAPELAIAYTEPPPSLGETPARD